MPTFNIHGRNLAPGEYRRVSANNRRGAAYLVVQRSGRSWYIDRNNEKTEPPTKSQVEHIFNRRYPGTAVEHTAYV